MTKGEDTKLMILEVGLDMASRLGLDAVSIGALAKATHMSKSGLFAHFQSKENLQRDILGFAGQLFSTYVIVPALKTEAGIPRIKALVDNWDRWVSKKMTGGCIFVQASSDFKDRDGKVRDFLLLQQEAWIDSLTLVNTAAPSAMPNNTVKAIPQLKAAGIPIDAIMVPSMAVGASPCTREKKANLQTRACPTTAKVSITVQRGSVR